MKKVYLFCSGGMSTSMLAKKMQEAADAHNLPIKVDAFSSSKVSAVMDRDNPDCLLLGPQVGFMLEDTESRYGEKCPVGVIDSDDYGKLDGERTLKYAIVLMKKFAGK